VWANKGQALDRLLAAQLQPDFLFAEGDDCTDEDVFERIRRLDGARRTGATRAAFVIQDFENVQMLLKMLTEASRPGGPIDKINASTYQLMLLTRSDQFELRLGFEERRRSQVRLKPIRRRTLRVSCHPRHWYVCRHPSHVDVSE